ncbi:type II CRISPR RNA-guided endonuclease Cas9 [Subsaximicrobium wynnwilliamsii]|uniref:CRISPR-associated endonuclease Cas9 n=1 Tax=Subsaximicrobium wynnwilliamsii TaxID=291179 RepID=A0A5C6ZMI0_9FLAO|nr:type II CRISPR RNA-guided endonuclease Cas9 [Subsaximicrobium wynnwilliamsii]TXD85525.1 type II CRISPR RNA-guided endonuclease Cas9 [Subsaximicrobium wynnwilliamsii]TXD90878.1 type II CRISPR RNA-guided endonuclease Cas9 [Subsaximicrobium wynnwilliamsii]TXE05385.1 type II CRISPR RNA-guided endonuclease Cas9 [Subsaximicrobium wynnwilliamsii]
MARILGLDLGTNSIGWALIDDEKKEILGIGSRIFPEGVVNLGEGEGRETSKNASRTEDRGVRRQFFRRRLRKRYLLRELAKHDMCPIDYNMVKVWNQKEIFSNKNLQEWLRLNPYQLRAKAINEEVSLDELGRIFYHMIQRRGFQSNSRSAGAETNEKSVIFKGDAKAGKIGIAETANSIEDHQTLGSYLNQIYPKENAPFTDELERIRNRYTTRQMYIDEFEAIWEHQKQYHSELTDELKTIYGGRKKDGFPEDGVLFHQRPLRSQKHLVGNCSLEPKKTKCQISAIPNEQRRIYEWLNTLKCDLAGEKVKINSEEREKILDLLFSKEKVKFKEIRKAIGKLDGHYQFNYKDDDAIYGSHTISNLSNKKFFGKAWFDFSDKEQEDIWHVLYSFDDRDKLKAYALERWEFNEEKAEKISKFNLKDGYANLSRKAISNMLPFLKLGFTYDIAVALGGVKNALGIKWEPQEDFMLNNVPEIVRSNLEGGYIAHLKEMLKKESQLSDKELAKLYHHSSNIEITKLLDRLPVNPEADKEIQSIKNPVVITALFEIRKLVNEIIDDYGKPDEIKVELARDLKISKSKRNDIRKEQQRLERENDRVKAELDYIGQRPTHVNILKYKLWEECNRTCPYTGRNIEVNQLFSGEVQIEHIYPWSRSLNDSFMNKTLCFVDENGAKGDLTPFEFYGKLGEQKWEAIKLQALSCFKNKAHYPSAYFKFKQFVKQKHDSDFISRQLNDTRYISKEANNYLSKICSKVMVAPGQMTSNLRHHWGLNSVLNLEDDTKTRDDHRHHAIDALVMACSTRGHLQELSKWNRYDRSYDLNNFPKPWESFREDAEKAVDGILVSHKKSKSILTVRKHITEKNGERYTNKGVAARGQLHKETVFAKRQAPNSDEAFHVRKPIDSLTTEKQLEKVVDITIKQLIFKRINVLGGFVKGKIPLETFFTVDENGNKQPQIFLPNKNGNPVPVLKVRMRENIGGAEQLKDDLNQWVNPRNNHHVLIYKDDEGNLKEDVVTFWTVVERKSKGFPVYQLPPDGIEIITAMQINDMFLLGLNEDEIDWENLDYVFLNDYLFKVQTLSSNFYEFRLNRDATQIKDTNSNVFRRIQSFGKGKTGWLTFNPIKVKVSVSGKIVKI